MIIVAPAEFCSSYGPNRIYEKERKKNQKLPTKQRKMEIIVNVYGKITKMSMLTTKLQIVTLTFKPLVKEES